MATFREMPGGRWQARVYRNGKHESIGTFSTKKEAEIKAGIVEKQLYYNETLTDRRMLFSEVIDNWFSHKTDTVKESTLEQLEVIKRLHIEPYFSEFKIFQITRSDVIKWTKQYEDMKDDEGNAKYSFGTRLKYLVTLKDVFSHAVNIMEVLHKAPTNKVNLATRGVVSVKQDIKYYKLNELDMLLNYLETYEPPRFKEYQIYYVLVYFLSRTGLRISEALSLRWSDLDGNKISINKQTSRTDNQLNITTLKTVSSYRVIEIDDDTVELLHSFRKIQQKMILKHSKFIRNKDVIIFQTYNGNYMTPGTIREVLKGYCLDAGIEYKGTHVFRHTHAVLGLESGADLLYISRRLGHGSIQTTADTYLDVTPQYEKGELSKITEHLNSNMAMTWQSDILAK